MFLLRNRQALEPFLFSHDRDAGVDLLKSLVIQWSSNPPEVFELSFEADCSLSEAQQVFLPLPRLGLLEVADAKRLAQIRVGSRYVPGFGLHREKHHFAVNLVFWRHRDKKAPQKSPVQVGANKKAKTNQPATFSLGAFLSMFDNRVNQHLMHELRLSRRFSTTKFHALQGRPVQGGLPSLGKRR